jgi:hypothetical protein
VGTSCQGSGGGGNLPCGKLSGQSLAGATAGFRSLTSAAVCPRVAKWAFFPNGVDWNALQAFKAACPGSKTVVRMYNGVQKYFATANDMWNERYVGLDNATPAQKATIDYLEADNECDAGHCFNNGPDYNNFLIQFVNRAASAGYHPLIGNISVGFPGVSIACNGDGVQLFGAIVPAIVAASQHGGGWGYHAYALDYVKDRNHQLFTAFRYRAYHDCFQSQIGNVPLILTEGGIAYNSDGGPTGGYLNHGGAGPFVDWLAWFQREIDGDSYVKGATLFAYDPNNYWWSFQLDPIEPQLENLIRTCP